MRINGWRGAGLLIMGVASLPRGWRYAIDIPNHLPPGINQLSFEGVAIRVLGVLWFIAAVAAIVFAFRLRDRWGIFAVAFMHALWAAALTLGWFFYGGGWLSASTTAGVFGLIVCWSRLVNPPSRVPAEILDRRVGE